MLRFKDLMERINETRSFYLEEVDLDESRMKDLAMDMESLSHADFKRKHKRSKQEMQSSLKSEGISLDELSVATMKSYGDKRARTAFSGGRKPGQSVDAGIAQKSRQSNSLSLARTKINRARDTGSTVLNKEEIEQIDELSPSTMGSYAKKASADFTARKPKMGYDGQLKKMQNRRVGVNRALDKMYGEEVESIDELSVNTVRSYYNKAGEQGKKISDKMKMGGGDWSKDGSDTKTLKKRAAGRNMAMRRRRGEVKMSEDAEQTDEALKGNQHKIDANKNGKVDGHDFKILRNAKKARYQ